jgi:sucrose-6F-phosphate phosphohydrolase
MRRMVATDMDGTFIGDDQAMHELWRDLEAAGITLTFSTGRHIPSIEAFYENHRVARRATACVCMVGTEVWFLDGDHYRQDPGWSDYISDAWDKDAVEVILHELSTVHIQDAEWQSPFKASYFLEDDAEAGLAHIKHRLKELDLRAKVVYSAGKFLDLLPYRSGKGGAVRYLAGKLGADEVVVAGDTGNDLDMMRAELGFDCIAVGNASEELAAVKEPQIYHASASYAAGIREGLEHYGWLSTQDRGADGR